MKPKTVFVVMDEDLDYEFDGEDSVAVWTPYASLVFEKREDAELYIKIQNKRQWKRMAPRLSILEVNYYAAGEQP